MSRAAERPATLVAGMDAAARAQPDVGFVFQDNRGNEASYPFPALLAAADRSAAGLQALGLNKGDRNGLLTQDPEEIVITFLGAVRAGIVPVPLYPPPPLGGIEQHLRQTEALLRVAEPRMLVTSAHADDLSGMAARLPFLESIALTRELRASTAPMRRPEIGPDDVCFLQFTSGSTSRPRAVIVTHRALVANIACFMDEALRAQPGIDKGVSWLPLYHDMGLIGFVLGPVYTGVPVVFLPTLRFAKSPSCWLEAIQRHGGTITFAPNFAYALLLRRVRPDEVGRWNLGSLKALGWGAEPLQPELIARFLDTFASAGLDPDAFMPAYGLAEATLAVAIRRLGQPVGFARIDRAAFETRGLALPASPGAAAIELFGFGGAFAGHEIEIRAATGERQPPLCEGEIWVRGPSTTRGYLGEPEVWAATCADGWLHTGDRGYLADGELFVSGRTKELIIVNGRNVQPQPVEWAVAQVDGVRANCVAAFAASGAHTEAIVIAVETRGGHSEALIAAVEEAVHGLVATRPSDVVLLPSGTLPRTTSGKLQRRELRSRYLAGDLPRLQKPA